MALRAEPRLQARAAQIPARPPTAPLPRGRPSTTVRLFRARGECAPCAGGCPHGLTCATAAATTWRAGSSLRRRGAASTCTFRAARAASSRSRCRRRRYRCRRCRRPRRAVLNRARRTARGRGRESRRPWLPLADADAPVWRVRQPDAAPTSSVRAAALCGGGRSSATRSIRTSSTSSRRLPRTHPPPPPHVRERDRARAGRAGPGGGGLRPGGRRRGRATHGGGGGRAAGGGAGLGGAPSRAGGLAQDPPVIRRVRGARSAPAEAVFRAAATASQPTAGFTGRASGFRPAGRRGEWAGTGQASRAGDGARRTSSARCSPARTSLGPRGRATHRRCASAAGLFTGQDNHAVAVAWRRRGSVLWPQGLVQ